MNDLLARLKAVNADMERRDQQLRTELDERREAASSIAESVTEGAPAEIIIEGQRVDRTEFQQETIVLRTGRPVLAIERHAAQLTFTDPDSKVWKQRLESAASHLTRAAQAVGRIEVEGHPLAWIGTGWLVRPDVIVTNRHVASEFGRQGSDGFVFRQGFTGENMSASIDFLEEIGRAESLTFRLERILHIERAEGPDVAFLQIAPLAGQTVAAPIGLAASANETDMVAVIGYPARDSRIPDQTLMDTIFGQVYDKKRLAPGLLTRVEGQAVRHDCSTLGGNSGSVVVSLQTGEAVGLHFAGRFLQANFAVPSTVVGERLDDVLSGETRRRSLARPVIGAPDPARSTAAAMPNQISYVFPVRVTIQVGEPHPDSGSHTVDRGARSQGSRPSSVAGYVPDTDEVFTEAVPADYRDREGYQDNFLGDDALAPLPEVTRQTNDVLTYTFEGRREQVLPYEHFSVLMSKGRRLCRFSAVNIDGKRSKSSSRVGWRTDPRIPLAAQIRHECYGDPPKFSRGHMTRREDPVWGGATAAAKGNADSMHVTNAVPQMQPFNAGIWLELENYALQNARRDDMKISVFTGPFLSTDDPVIFDVAIPLEFWKVIAFIHDETGELCATGYTMSQRDFISEDEFVFGKHKTAQRSIASIEARTGLSFGPLAALDPFEDVEATSAELTDLSQIRFIRRR